MEFEFEFEFELELTLECGILLEAATIIIRRILFKRSFAT